MPDRIPYDEFVKIYKRVPRAVVELVNVNSDGLLMLKRAIPPGIGNWHLPGGTILFNETIEQAVQRVALEEVGLKVKSFKFLKVFEWVNTDSVIGHDLDFIHQVEFAAESIKLDHGSSQWQRFKTLPEPTFPEYKKIFTSIPNVIDVS